MNHLGTTLLRLQLLLTRHRGERGASAVEWLLLLSAVIGIVAIANTGVRGYVTGLVGNLNQ